MKYMNVYGLHVKNRTDWQLHKVRMNENALFLRLHLHARTYDGQITYFRRLSSNTKGCKRESAGALLFNV
jgi:uncharacterized protein (DUF1919 family)